MVILTLERYFAICHPEKAKVFNTPSRTKLLIGKVVDARYSSAYTVCLFVCLIGLSVILTVSSHPENNPLIEGIGLTRGQVDFRGLIQDHLRLVFEDLVAGSWTQTHNDTRKKLLWSKFLAYYTSLHSSCICCIKP